MSLRIVVVAAAGIVGALAATSSLGAPPLPDRCPVTIPNGSTPPGVSPSAQHHGNSAIWVGLWPDGVLNPEPEWEQADGSIRMKFMWWRGVEGRLTIEGRRLDGVAPPLRSRVPNGYGTIGFQATVIFFPTPGCWEVTGNVGTASLRFVLLVLPVTEEDRRGESSCTSAQLWMALWEFAKAFNAGNLRRLDSLFARPPVFKWYSSPSPGARLGAAAYRRGTLIRYFARRHAKRDRLRLTEFRYHGNSGGYGHFDFDVIRSAADYRRGAAFNAFGKGTVACTAWPRVIALLSFGGPT
jgi:hypothetical protein